MLKVFFRPISEILLWKKNATEISERFLSERELIVLGHSHFISPILKVLILDILLDEGSTLPMHKLKEINNTGIHLLNTV